MRAVVFLLLFLAAASSAGAQEKHLIDPMLPGELGSAIDVVAPNQRDVDPRVWTPRHTALIRTAAQDAAVVRILVNAAIKKALCREAGADRTWLYKVRPWYGHAEHFHVQLACPPDRSEERR